MPLTKFSPRRASRSPRFDLSKLGPGARAQLQAQGVEIRTPPGQGRYRKAPAEERTVAGIVFDSKWEARAYHELTRHLPVTAVALQPEFELQPGFTDSEGKRHRPIFYVADFQLTLPDGVHILDTKGHLTEVFRLKEKMFLHRYQRALHKIYDVSQLREFLVSHGVLLRN